MTRRWAAGLVFIAVVVWAVLPVAAQEGPRFVGLRVGFEGRYKVGLWTPVEVTLRGGSQQLQGVVTLTVPDGDDVPSEVISPPATPVQVLPGQDASALLYVRFGRTDCQLAARFVVDGTVAAETKFETSLEPEENQFRRALSTSQRLIVEVGPASVGASEAVELLQEPPEDRSEVARLDAADGLPARWYGYEGVDALVLATSRPEIYRTLSASSERAEALEQWVHSGGTLVLCIGAEAEEILRADSPLARLAPGRLAEVVRLRQTGPLETYCESSRPVPQDDSRILAPRLTDVQGVVQVREGNVPIVVRTAHGFGQVVFVGVDLDRPPFARWQDRGGLLAKLLGLAPAPEERSSERAAVMHYGYTDIAGQLRSALDRFANVRVVPFWLVVAMILLYVLLIGPGDYLLVRRVLRRMGATWITFPLTVVGVSLAAYVLAYYLKGNQIRVNQVDLVDVDASSQSVRGTAWANIFSPRLETYNVTFRPDRGTAPMPPATPLTAWFGLPGEGLGGMNPRTSNPTIWKRHYTFSPDLAAMRDMPIQVWSTKSVTGRWLAAAAACPKAELLATEQVPEGTIANTLDFPLADCLLVYGRWAYDLGRLEPGQSIQVSPLLRRVSLQTLLTGRKIVFDPASEKYEQEMKPYDQSSRDVHSIMLMMMFFRASGGRGYTGLVNQYQQFVDASDLLDCDRAILVARDGGGETSPRHGAELLHAGQPLAGPDDQHTTVYRFVFPVKAEAPFLSSR